jgi:pimeloyl-ACP methyl ester carboxylesterase
MMKIIKTLGIIVLVIFAIITLLLIASFANHTIQLRKEAKKYPPPGNMVEVDGQNLHVYLKGDGDTTLVFMAGHGTSNPTLDFKPLWMRLVDDYRIAVVEKSGYGWSEVSSNPRDIDTILEETRRSLELSGEEGPYVLLPHSMSGLEALYWAQKYPDEVKAIIGLDPLIPEAFDIMPEPQKTQLYPMVIISRLGISRFMPETEIEINFPVMKSGDLSEEDKQEYLAVFYKSAFSKDMLREIDYLKANAQTVAENEIPINTPMYFFISESQEAAVPGWKDALSGYLSKITIGKYMELSSGHYIHYDKSETIVEEAITFLKTLD